MWAEEAGTGDTGDNGKLFYFPNLSSIKAASSEVAAAWAGLVVEMTRQTRNCINHRILTDATQAHTPQQICYLSRRPAPSFRTQGGPC